MTKKTILMALFCAGISIAAFAQEEPGAAQQPEMTVDTSKAFSGAEEDLDNKMDDFIVDEMGWKGGENRKADGSLFYVAKGIGGIQVPRTDKNYTASRMIAFDIAMLQAKRSMAEYLGTTISTALEYYAEAGDMSAPIVAKELQEYGSTITDKLLQLIHAKLDAALRAEGIDPNRAAKEALAEAMKKQILEEDFQKSINLYAQSCISGMQTFKVYESSPANKKGKIGVIAIWSPMLQRMAEAMCMENVTMPSNTPKKRITDQIPSDPQELLSMMGVRQFTDENGQLVIVSFSQASPVSDNPTAENLAFRTAMADAMSRIRQFASETVISETDVNNSQTHKEFENAAEENQVDAHIKDRIKSVSAAMNFSGLGELRRKKAKHPLSEQTVCISICSWSPSAAANAKALKKQMEERPKANEKNNNATADKNKTDKEKAAQGKSYYSESPTADLDSF